MVHWICTAIWCRFPVVSGLELRWRPESGPKCFWGLWPQKSFKFLVKSGWLTWSSCELVTSKTLRRGIATSSPWDPSPNPNIRNCKKQRIVLGRPSDRGAELSLKIEYFEIVSILAITKSSWRFFRRHCAELRSLRCGCMALLSREDNM